MTKDEIFRKVVRGLARQGFERCVRGAHCAYISDDGSKRCAAGHLLTKREAEAAVRSGFGSILSDGTFGTDDAEPRTRFPRITKKQVALVRDLQEAHDISIDMRAALRRVAEQHGISIEGLPL